MNSMRMRRFRRSSAALAAAVLMSCGPAAFAGEASPAPSPEASATSQDLLFETPWLASAPAPSRFIYKFSSVTADDSQYGRSFDDQASMKVSANGENPGRRDVFITLFSGDREREIGAIAGAAGNPMLMVFLERDMARMKMHVGGQPVYYRNRIRAALQEHAKVEPVSFSFNGATVNGQRITIQPFKDDPLAERMRLFKSKVYEFTVSDAVPGGIYEIRSSIPALVAAGPGADAAKPLIEERLTFARVEAESGASRVQ